MPNFQTIPNRLRFAHETVNLHTPWFDDNCPICNLQKNHTYTRILGLKSNVAIIQSKNEINMNVQNVPMQTVVKANCLLFSTFPYIGTAQNIIAEAKGMTLLCLNYIRLDPEMRKNTHNEIYPILPKATQSVLL